MVQKEIKNSAILISGITAILYYAGYLYESIYLQTYQIISDELMPDGGRLIAYGFTVVFVEFCKSFPTLFWALVFVGVCKQPVTEIVMNNKVSNTYITKHIPKGWRDVLQYGTYPLLVILLFLFIYNYASKQAISDMKDAKINSKQTIVYIKSNKEGIPPIRGRVIRYINNKVGVFDADQGRSYIIESRNIEKIVYPAVN